jgi:hypothetical protein
MFHKTFKMMISNLYSISTLSAFAKPAVIVPMTSSNDTQVPATKTHSLTPDTPVVSTGFALSASQEGTSHAASINTDFGR